ncbi:hypothetical protein HK101_004917 [Irineochytrium annulatum]|nr:hypothetical protein HK101_004917 [Irineochytrium annulatum]
MHGRGGLYWDSSLASDAQNVADSLANQNCILDHGGRQGENLWELGGRQPSGWCQHAIGDWMAEGFSGSMNDLNHATQMLWDTTTAMGCAMSYSSAYNCEVVVCHYNPIGNFIGQGNAPSPF